MSRIITQKWVRIAGIAKRIKELEPPPHWRFEVENESQQYPLHDFRLTGGTPTLANNQPGTNPGAKEPDLLAWISYYVAEMIVHDNGMALIVLGTPTDNQPNPWS